MPNPQAPSKTKLQQWREDPFLFQRDLWPHVEFFDKQRDMIASVCNNKETQVVAGNMLGKDFTSAFIMLWFFITHYHLSRKRPWVRCVTTSVKGDHLRVLWAEAARFLDSSRVPLLSTQGGPFVLLNQELRHVSERDLRNPINYLLGQVSAKGEGMSGHHAENTLFIADEASGVDQVAYEHAIEWAKKTLIFGNPNPCTNFFYHGVKGGDLLSAVRPGRYDRKVIRICAEDSPNVKLALLEIQKGLAPSLRQVVPGALSYPEYKFRRDNWDPVLQTIKLDACFYEGADALLCPPEWLNGAEALAATQQRPRRGLAMGIDTAEGGDSTVWAIGDKDGLIKLVSLKTPNTAEIAGRTIALQKEYQIEDKMVLFDRGGGGQVHYDYLRERGHKYRVVSFGEAANPEKVRHRKLFDQKKYESEQRYTYKNKRAQMYHLLRLKIDPNLNRERDEDAPQSRFGLPAEYTELRRQLSQIPMLYDEEGRIYLPPKRKKPGTTNSNVVSLEEILGCSPDEADAVAMMVYAMDPTSQKISLKPMF